MSRSGFLACFVCLACSAGADTTWEEHAFDDEAGRTCRARLEKASSSAASLSQAVSCDAEGKACSKDSQPCFQLNFDAMTEALYNCPACCLGTASSFVQAECSPLICATDADCVYARSQCVGGACVCPSGACE